MKEFSAKVRPGVAGPNDRWKGRGSRTLLFAFVFCWIYQTVALSRLRSGGEGFTSRNGDLSLGCGVLVLPRPFGWSTWFQGFAHGAPREKRVEGARRN